MPAETVKQRRAAAIAKHHPEELYKRNVGLLKMKPKQLHEFAATKEKGLPKGGKSNPRGKHRKRRRLLDH